VLLRPSLETLLARNASRTNKPFDSSILETTIRRLHDKLENLPAHALENWFVLDSSKRSLPETVDRILEHFEIAPNA
jgi:hypothetical protein